MYKLTTTYTAIHFKQHFYLVFINFPFGGLIKLDKYLNVYLCELIYFISSLL